MNKSEELREEALKRVFRHLSKNENSEVVHPTEHDESDDLEEAKNIVGATAQFTCPVSPGCN
jgi:hypothetical protein